jgi:hypothetical protein
LCGAAQVAARWWLQGARNGEMSQEEAERLITQLAWRGIADFPLQHEH